MTPHVLVGNGVSALGARRPVQGAALPQVFVQVSQRSNKVAATVRVNAAYSLVARVPGVQFKLRKDHILSAAFNYL